MSSYIINATKGSDTGTITPDVGFNYTDKLNDVNESMIKISGTGSVRRGLLAMGTKIEIKKDGTRVFYGLLDNIDYLDGGAINFHVSGYEIWLAKENGSYANSPWKNTASATIFADLIAESNYFTAGTIEAGSNVDFRVAKTDSLWNGSSNLARKVTQDIQIDYVNFEIDVLDHRGSTTSVATFNDGTDILNLRKSEAYPLGNKIIVYGKGDGANQITATASDATSIAAYGEITRIVTDRTIMSTSEAQKLANAELAITKDPVQIYDFDVNNPNQSFIAGDVITLNSTDKDLDNEEVRIVGIDRGVRGGVEHLTLQVTNSAYSSLIKKRNDILAKVVKQQRDADTYMQGSGNTQSWARGINAKSGNPLVVPFYVSSDFVEDEAGNLRIDSLTLDYDVDPYRRGVGSASENNKEPALDGSTAAASHGHNPYETGSGHDHQNPATTSAVSLSFQGDTGKAAEQGSSSNLTSGSWNVIGDFSSSYITSCEGHHVHIDFENDNASSMYWYVRVELGAGYYYPNSTGIRVRAAANAWASLDFVVPVQAFTGSPLANYDIEVKPDAANSDLWHYHWWIESHKHNISSYNSNDNKGTLDDSNRSPSVSGKTVLHAHDVSVGDDVSDAGSVNASEVDIYLDFWNTGTSNWDNKHSVLNTGKTMDTDLDITNGGTYPDAVGFWRVRINPDHASPDLVQGIIKLKHQLDN